MGVFTRTVTNVGAPNATYTAATYMPSTFTVAVEPPVLKFSNVGEKQSFTVTVSGPKISQQPIMSGDILWTDGVGHVVRTPVVVYNYVPGAPYNLEEAMTENKPTTFGASSMYRKKGVFGH